MAIYHMSMNIISRGKGQSAIAAASYRSGEKLYSERYNKTSFYGNRSVAPVSFILKPEHAPEWCLNRERLWNEVEKSEKYKNAQLSREFNVALPVELSNDEQEKLIKDYCNDVFVSDGMVADISIHRDDKNNPHAHVMLTVRPFNEDGSWGSKSKLFVYKDEEGNTLKNVSGNRKTRKIDSVDWNSKDKLLFWREQWANYTNNSLRENGYEISISEKSFKEQGIDLEPTIHEGFVARKMEQNGYVSDRMQINRDIKEINLIKGELKDVNESVETLKEAEKIHHMLTPKELGRLREAKEVFSKYINPENIDKIRLSLHRFGLDAEVKKLYGEDIDSPQTDFVKRKELLDKAEAIILNESKRIVVKHYPQIDLEKISDYQIREVASVSLKKGKLSDEKLNEVLIDSEAFEPQFLISRIIRSSSIKSLVEAQNSINENGATVARILDKYGLTTSDKNIASKIPSTFDGASKVDSRENFLNAYKQLQLSRTALKVLNAHYDEFISRKFPSLETNNLNVAEKEKLKQTIIYYGDSIDAKKLLNIDATPIFRYSKTEINDAMDYLKLQRKNLVSLLERGGRNNDDTHRYIVEENINNRFDKLPQSLKDAIKNPYLKQFVMNEAIDYGIVSEDEIKALNTTIKKNTENDGTEYYNRTPDGMSYPTHGATDFLNSIMREKSMEQLINELDVSEREKMKVMKRAAKNPKKMNNKKGSHRSL